MLIVCSLSSWSRHPHKWSSSFASSWPLRPLRWQQPSHSELRRQNWTTSFSVVWIEALQRRSARRFRSYSRRRVRISAPPGAPCPTTRRLSKPRGRAGEQVVRRSIHRVGQVSTALARMCMISDAGVWTLVQPSRRARLKSSRETASACVGHIGLRRRTPRKSPSARRSRACK